MKYNYKEIKYIDMLDEYKDIIGLYRKIIGLGIEDYKNKIKDYSDEEKENEGYKIRKMSYRLELLLICGLRELWEQDLYNFLKDRGILNSISSNDYGFIENKYNEIFSSNSISNYPNLDEMKNIVNAIKHGEGRSYNNIISQHPEYLADSGIGDIAPDGTMKMRKEIEFDKCTLTSMTLKVDGLIDKYYEDIKKFWIETYRLDCMIT